MARPKYRAIVDDIAERIRSGSIQAGERLPTHRALAYEHGLSLGTATRVYTELLKLGLVSGEIGRGTFARSPVITKASDFHYDREAPEVIDLSRNFMVLEEQEDYLQNAVARIMNEDAYDMLTYQPHAGRDRDRATGASWLSNKNFSVEPSQLIICNGAQHGLALSLIATTQPGDTVAVESYTYPGLKVLAGVLGIELVAVPFDECGLIPTALEEICTDQRIKAICCMPTIQNPLGSVMPEKRRQELAAISASLDIFIIEDDAYGFLAEDAPAPIAACAPERTFYLRTVSKSLAPGLRVAYLSVPEDQVARVTRILRATTWTAPPLMPAIATQWIEDGTADKLIQNKRAEAIYRQNLAAGFLSDFENHAHPASYHLWLELPPGCRTDTFLLTARERNVLVSPASIFAVGGGAVHPAVRLCLGAPKSRTDLTQALQIIRDVLREDSEGLLGMV